MTRAPFRALALSLPLAALVGCESVESSDVKTSGMYAQFTAQADGSGSTRTEAILKVGGSTSNTFVQLAAGDELTVAGGGAEQAMSEQNLGDLYSYTADFDFDEVGTEFTFNLERAADESAPSSVATLPAALDITAPAEDAIVSRSGDALTITWSGSGEAEDMEVTVTGDCFVAYWKPVDDGGQHIIDAGTMESFEGNDDEACDAEVTVTRKSTGTLDPAFGEGTVTGEQIRTVKIRMDP